MEMSLKIVSILVMVVAAQIAMTSFCFSHLGYVGRGLFATAALQCAIYLFAEYLVFGGLGLTVFEAVLIWQFMTNRKEEPATVSS
jgi:hypothetical protein